MGVHCVLTAKMPVKCHAFAVYLLTTFFIVGATPCTAAGIELRPLGVYSSGVFDGSAAEISAYDKSTRRLFVANRAGSCIDVLDISDPGAPHREFSIPVGSVNSVACSNGVLAVAVANETPTNPGFVHFYSVSMKGGDGAIKSIRVGALPDMVTFTPDGQKVLVANEGEPGEIDPDGSVSVIDLSAGIADASVKTATFGAFEPEALRASGVRLFPGKTPCEDLEPEYIAVEPGGTTAYVSLQEANAVAKLDVETATITDVLPLGTKDHSRERNALDPSDCDHCVRISTWPVRSFFMPDSIAAYKAGGESYFVTANEGDARHEAERVGNLKIDPEKFPNLVDLQQDDHLGRLEVSTIDGDIDGDGDYDELFAYGARSFSIWDASGRQVFDSGCDFERITSSRLPKLFNASNESQAFDSRSDQKGPEPEGVALASIDDRVYAFIGLERVGGVMIYDITSPERAAFVDYVNPRVSAEGECKELGNCDLGPEGLLVIPKQDSPTRDALLVVTNEVSGTTTLYAITPQPNPVVGGRSADAGDVRLDRSSFGIRQ